MFVPSEKLLHKEGFSKGFSPRWSHWVGLHVSARVWQYLCGPAGLPGAEGCSPSAAKKKAIKKFWRTKEETKYDKYTKGGADKEFYPCLGVHMSLLLQKELHHLDVAIMTGHVKGCVAHLSQREKTASCCLVALVIPINYQSKYRANMCLVIWHTRLYKDKRCHLFSSSHTHGILWLCVFSGNDVAYTWSSINRCPLFDQSVCDAHMTLLGHKMQRSQSILQRTTRGMSIIVYLLFGQYINLIIILKKHI